MMKHLEEIEAQIQLRKEAEEHLRVLVESSPAAILTVDSQGKILLATKQHRKYWLLDRES